MKPVQKTSRRRFLGITASVAGLGLLGHGSAARALEFQTWQGTALGARASIRLYHPDPATAQGLIEQARLEIERLEQVFSLYRADSALSRLNRQGALAAAPLDLVRLLAESRRYGKLTGGGFDVTVQALWELYAEHFARAGADGAEGPHPGAISAALARVDYRAVSVDLARIAFEKPGMAVTLNGIAQGYITDRVVELLRAAGLKRSLIDLGEMRAIGRHPAGRYWSAGLRDPRSGRPLYGSLALDNAALATSSGLGTRFDAAGEYHHLFDPGSGRSARRYLSLSVRAPTATEADALSTGLFSLDPDRIAALVAGRRAVTAVALLPDGTVRQWDS